MISRSFPTHSARTHSNQSRDPHYRMVTLAGEAHLLQPFGSQAHSTSHTSLSCLPESRGLEELSRSRQPRGKV